MSSYCFLDNTFACPNNSYGYNGKGCRNNIILLPSEEILYFVAKVKVIMLFDFNLNLLTLQCNTKYLHEIKRTVHQPTP